MMMRIPFMRHVAWYLVVAVFVIGIAPRTEAGFAPSAVVGDKIDRSSDLQKIGGVLEMKVVSDRLDKLGFSADEVRAKLDKLSDGEVHQLAQKIDDLKVGGDGMGFVIGLLVIVILVIVILQLTGHKVLVTK